MALMVAAILFMQNLDGAIITTSLPQMALTFRATPVALNIAITAYFMAAAAFIPISGRLSDRLGARQVLAAAVFVFVLGSIGCSVALTLPQFIGARVVQRLGGAMMLPVGRIIVLKSACKDQLLSATALIT